MFFKEVQRPLSSRYQEHTLAVSAFYFSTNLSLSPETCGKPSNSLNTTQIVNQAWS
jgi:hypothetical protein